MEKIIWCYVKKDTSSEKVTEMMAKYGSGAVCYFTDIDMETGERIPDVVCCLEITYRDHIPGKDLEEMEDVGIVKEGRAIDYEKIRRVCEILDSEVPYLTEEDLKQLFSDD